MLAGLEGWGQDRRRTAAIQATIHNATEKAIYAQHAGKDTPVPKILTESDFLPRRVKKQQQQQKAANTQAANNRKLFSALNSMCGY